MRFDSIVEVCKKEFSEEKKQENSESGFSADKRCDEWKVWQRFDDRIDTAVMCEGVWHNILWLGSDT
ncbi:MAG: hypothetical protein QXS17_01910 [Candidatus Micrarchaeaceae archaeon]